MCGSYGEEFAAGRSWVGGGDGERVVSVAGDLKEGG